MTVEYMRNRINEAYGGKWLALHDMPDNQIIAIFHSMKEKGKFDKPARVKKPVERYYQLSIFDTDEYLQSIGK